MQNIRHGVLTVSLISASLISFSTVIAAKKHPIEIGKVPACEQHEKNTTDYHVHDQANFLHMRLSDANDAGPHARMEIRAM